VPPHHITVHVSTNIVIARCLKLFDWNCCQSQSYITTDGQSASLTWCQAPIWDPRPVLSLLSLIIFRQLWVCWCGAPLWREVGSLVFSFCRASSARPFSDLRPTGLMSIFYCLNFSDPPPPQPGGPGSGIYFPQKQGGPVIPPDIGLCFLYHSCSVLVCGPIYALVYPIVNGRSSCCVECVVSHIGS
jgi:hypothetical protein